MQGRRRAALGLAIALAATWACDTAGRHEDLARRRRTVSPGRVSGPTGADARPVWATAHRIVRELDPPLAPGEPEECAVADDFRPALGCLESLPLGPDARTPRPPTGRMDVAGSVPRRFWGRPMLIEPRVRGEAVAGFQRASAKIVDSSFLGFSFETELPALDGQGDIELQLRAYVVPPPIRDFTSTAIDFAENDALTFALGLEPLGLGFTTGPVTFEISALRDGEERPLFRETLDAAAWTGTWLDRRVELGALAGHRARLRFRTTATSPEGADAIGFPLWGAPEVLRRTSRGALRNVIVISLDTWRHDHFDTDVSGGPVTPELAQLAESGAVFRQAVSTYPSTSASHMSLLTGLYPITHQVRFANDVLGDTIPTLAEILAAHGYQTGAVTENAMLLADSGFAFGFDSYFENKGLGLWSTEGQIDSTLERGGAWLDAHRDERFFLFLHTYQIHTPYEPRAEDVYGPTEEELRSSEVPWVTKLRHLYAGEVRYADRALARFLRSLSETGMLADSIVVLTSDHGEEFAEHDRMGHSKSVYDEVLRVPLLMWAPGLIPPGRRIDELVSLVDVVPTILDLLEIEPPTALQGTSLRSGLERGTVLDDGPRFAEGPDTARPGHRLIAARTGSHKWIARDDSPVPARIFDLRSDPGETRSLEDEDLRAEGRGHLEEYRSLLSGSATKRELDARTTEKLRALGYLE